MEHLSIKEAHDRLQELKGWEMEGSEIVKTFEFEKFKEAMKFVAEVGEEAERQNHHPDIDIRYTKITIKLTTHSEKALTHKDFKLAKIIEQMI